MKDRSCEKGRKGKKRERIGVFTPCWERGSLRTYEERPGEIMKVNFGIEPLE
jgi:hypothetical protein